MTGEAIMCAIIASGKTMKPEVVTGLDLFATKIGNETDDYFILNNTGSGKLYPNGPTCQFKGKEVPCVVCNTENGSITSELLVSFLKHMDALNLFPRDNGVMPFLLLDGHGSRLELPFLKYINEPQHNWIVCIGVPYGTSYWQVADSLEQNGSYKMALATAKKNIVNVVNDAWKKSFAWLDYNKKAIAVRGWYPLTRNLLDHPEIAASEDLSSISDSGNERQSTSDNQHSVAATLNYQSGLANTVISNILQKIDREAVHQTSNIRANQEEGRQAMVAFAEAKKLTAGVVFKSGRAWLGPEVLQAAVENKRKRDEIEQGVAD
jgi:hypothetical protein